MLRRVVGSLVVGSFLFGLFGCAQDPQEHAQSAGVRAQREAVVEASEAAVAPFLGLGTVVGSRVGDWCDTGQNGPWHSVYKFKCSYETHHLVVPAQASLDEATAAALVLFDRAGCTTSQRPADARDRALESRGNSGVVGGTCGDVGVHLTAYVDDRQALNLNSFTPFPSTGFWVERTMFTDEALAGVGTTRPFMWAIKTSVEYAYETR